MVFIETTNTPKTYLRFKKTKTILKLLQILFDLDYSKVSKIKIIKSTTSKQLMFLK